MKKVLLTGASGYVGSYILKELLNRGYYVNCLIRKGRTIPYSKNVNIIIGDLLDKKSVEEAVKDVDAVLHVGAAVRVKDPKINYDVNVIGTRNIVDACIKNKIRRIVYMSSVSAVRKRKGPYGRTKFLGELEIKKPEIDYTILRPPIIYGKEGQGINNIINYVTKFPFFIPVVGSGNYSRQPVSVYDVASVTIDVIYNKKTFNKEYGLACDKQITFKNLVKLIRDELNIKKVIIPIPVFLCNIMAGFFELAMKKPLFTREHVRSIREGVDLDVNPLIKDAGFKPVDFEEGIRQLLIEKGMKK